MYIPKCSLRVFLAQAPSGVHAMTTSHGVSREWPRWSVLTLFLREIGRNWEADFASDCMCALGTSEDCQTKLITYLSPPIYKSALGSMKSDGSVAKARSVFFSSSHRNRKFRTCQLFCTSLPLHACARG